MQKPTHGFTLIELMFTLVVAAIAVSLAVPTYRAFFDKRELTATAEDIASFVKIGQSLAIKRNKPVNLSWQGSSSHSANFCIGMSAEPKAMACNCWQTNPNAGDFCSVDGVPYRLTKGDFTKVGHEFMHFNPAVGNFNFGPVRGIVSTWSNGEIVDDDWLFYMHSSEGSGNSRLLALELRLAISGRMSICYQTNRVMALGQYPAC